ncbi:hypothetical protein Veis_0198 [Verminephrobacter eiseniae EF01-2]|uniref:Uncharacterized protein n=1 Tax=Verminephrobacter eiseniae (strain EF01-2) TaxID=391735 RepID=A1WED3_VEREI|nr:hypothetical protein Veis_0198 [Verminephrobacter eiseniae EF01-2]MCW5286362.1 hypothetical protein [Verminephrobacter eiseniae]MCW5304661.1 hypothetical protein [Verminephrobacter eiseniae]MCW8182010.1 hypothetical protein [Verminephrobacter eiseniae]MCW8191913.1 hypothetical protein [Verminephrobacter eiseniae]
MPGKIRPERDGPCARQGAPPPRESLRSGSRAAVDRALSRLSRQGKLLRVARGPLRHASAAPARPGAARRSPGRGA